MFAVSANTVDACCMSQCTLNVTGDLTFFQGPQESQELNLAFCINYNMIQSLQPQPTNPLRTRILPLGGSKSQHVLKTMEAQSCQLKNSMTAGHQYGLPLSKLISFIIVTLAPIPPTGLNPSPRSHLIPHAVCIFFLSWEALQYMCSVIYLISINQKLIIRQEKIICKNIAIRETASALKESWV